MVAVGILLAMLWGLVLEVVRVAAGVLVTAALWLDVALVALWDLCCKPFTAVWNTLLAERTVFARTLPRIHYCDPRDLIDRLPRDLRETEDRANEDVRCFCTPLPAEPPADDGARARTIRSRWQRLMRRPSPRSTHPSASQPAVAGATNGAAGRTNGHARRSPEEYASLDCVGVC